MKKNARDIIIGILQCIGSDENNEVLADEFLDNCIKQALIDVLEALPKEKQEEFTQKQIWAADEVRKKEVIKEYVSPEDYAAALKKACETAFTNLINELSPTLSPEQANKLQTYMQSVVQ